MGDDERNTERVQSLRQVFQAQVAAVAPENLVFIDESGVNRAMTRTHARSLRGTRAYGFAPRHWGDNVSVLGALSLRGTLEPMCIHGSTTGPVFLSFLEHFLVPHLWPGAVVVMNNLGAHKVKGVREQIEAAGARLLSLSPYSADFNPIEMVWSKLKTFLARHRRPRPGHRRRLARRQFPGRPRLLRPLRLCLRLTQPRTALVILLRVA